jgi:uncharacterized protein (TIGR03083 family)
VIVTETTQDVQGIPRIQHDEAMAITAVENQKLADQLRSFTAVDWSKPTDCTRWDVRAVASHLVGAAAGQASPREFVRQVRKGKPIMKEIGSEHWWDGANELQVRERETLTNDEIIGEWVATSARALKARTKLPRPIANLPLLKLPEPIGRQSLAYLFDIGFTRDCWMHRIDMAVATGKPFEADGEHDGRIVADIVAEWATTHGEPFTLVLDGPMGGRFTSVSGGEHVEMDAIEFCRTLAERLPGAGVMQHTLPL